MVRLHKSIATALSLFLVNVALSLSSPCRHAFIVYNADKGTEVTRFTDAKHPPQFTVDTSKLRGIFRLNVVASFCNNDPPLYHSAILWVRNLSATTLDYYGPLVVRTAVWKRHSQNLTVSGDFLKMPGLYRMYAISYDDSIEVIVSVYRSCQRGFVLYNTDNQTEIARFPDFGIHPHNFETAITTLIASTQGVIDLLRLGSIGMNLVAEFCNPLVKNVTFTGTSNNILSVSRYPPFSLGPKDKKFQLLPTNFLKTPKMLDTSEPPPITAVANVDSMGIFLNIHPTYRVLSFTLINARTGKDLATAAVTDDGLLFDPYSHLQLDLAAYPANTSFSIRANTPHSSVQSVHFENSVDFTANKEPFALAGVTSAGNYKPVDLLSKPDYYVVDATPYAGPKLSGNSGPLQTLFVTVLPRSRIASITLIDATSNSDIYEYQYDGIYGVTNIGIYPLQYPNSTFTIRCNPVGKVGSVEFNLVDDSHDHRISIYHHVSNGPPHCLLGSKTGESRHCKAVPVFQAPGRFLLNVIAFAGVNMQGDARSTEASIEIFPKFKIVRFTAVDASTGKDFFDFVESQETIDLSKFPADLKIAIRAYTEGNVGSIAFSFSGIINGSAFSLNHVENGPPFSVAGVSSSTGRLLPIPYMSAPGRYSLIAVPFSQKNKAGSMGRQDELSIEVLDRLRIKSFTLVDATTGIDLTDSFGLSTWSIVMYLHDYPKNTKFSVRADTVGDVGSVAFELYPGNGVWLNGTVDNHEPFALGGDTTAGGYQAVSQFSVPWYYHVVATPYSKSNKQGYKGTSFHMNFDIYL